MTGVGSPGDTCHVAHSDRSRSRAHDQHRHPYWDTAHNGGLGDESLVCACRRVDPCENCGDIARLDRVAVSRYEQYGSRLSGWPDDGANGRIA